MLALLSLLFLALVGPDAAQVQLCERSGIGEISFMVVLMTIFHTGSKMRFQAFQSVHNVHGYVLYRHQSVLFNSSRHLRCSLHPDSCDAPLHFSQGSQGGVKYHYF